MNSALFHQTETNGFPAPSARTAAEPQVTRLESARGYRRAFRETRPGWIVLLAIWLISAVYLGVRLPNRSFTIDMGVLGQAAERVLHGQVPCRDFRCVYTGGEDYLNALSFRVFGVTAISLRIPLFLFFLGWIPAVYFIARRFASPLVAAGTTLLALVWSVPNYPEASPSWYLLFFATWGALALLRYTETDNGFWLWVAGACCGLSTLVKTPGLYFLAGALLFLAFREQSLLESAQPPSPGLNRAYRIFAVLSLAVFFCAIVDLIGQRPLFRDFFQFAFPSAFLAVYVAWSVWRRRSETNSARFRSLIGMVAPLLVGFATPLAVWVLFLWNAGALHDWFRQTFLLSARHLQWTVGNPVGVAAVIGLVPAVLVILVACQRKSAVRHFTWLAWFVGVAAVLVAARTSLRIYEILGISVPLVVPLIALATPLSLNACGRVSPLRRQQAFLLVAIATLCALIQFPMSTVLYFYHVAPLEILAILALVSLWDLVPGPELGSLLVFYLLFAVWLHTPGYFAGTARYEPGHSVPLQHLAIARASDIRVPPEQAGPLDRVIRIVKEHAGGLYIYAAPDQPEIYFLSGLRNPTRDLLDYLDPDLTSPLARTARIMNDIQNHGVNVVVIGRGPSGPIPVALRAGLDAEFPHSLRTGPYEVRWRVPGDPPPSLQLPGVIPFEFGRTPTLSSHAAKTRGVQP